MIVDDNDGDRHLLREAIDESKWSADITEADSSNQAMDHLPVLLQMDMPPDLILIDYVLRRGTCIEAIGRIRNLPGYESTSIIVMTTVLPPEINREQCYSLGVLRILIKSFVYPSLVLSMKKLKEIFHDKGHRSRERAGLSDSDLALLETVKSVTE
jgi:CheY-like chemotaxis protein